MCCEYYIQSELVIVYYDNQGSLSTTRTNRVLEKGYIVDIPDEDTDDDQETQYKKFQEEIKRCIKRHTYKKMLYDDIWIKDSYKKRYLQNLNIICPRLVKIVKVYKDYCAWERNGSI